MSDYAEVNDVLAYLRISDSNDTALVRTLITQVSRMIDDYCDRQFYQDAAVSARVFSTESWDVCSVDDISTTTGLIIATDQNNDGTYETTWSSTDYQLEPLNGLARNRAVHTIRATGRNYQFPTWRTAGVQVTARWGWPAIPAQIGEACILQVARLVMRRQAPGGIISMPDLGVAERLYASMDPDARVLLAPFVRGERLP